MSKYKKLGINTLYVFMGNAGAKLLSLAMLPLYTRWLTVDDYGTTDIISVYVSFLINIISCCIAESLFIFPKDQSENDKKEYFTTTIIFSIFVILCSGFIFFILYLFSIKHSIYNSFTRNLWFIYGMIIATLIQSLMQQFCRSIDKMKIYSTTGIILTGAIAFFSFLLIPKYKVNGYVLAIILGNIISGTYSFIASKSIIYISIKGYSYIKLVQMLKYSVPLIPNAIMWWTVSALNRPIMEDSLGIHSVGIFAVANKFPGIVSMLFSLFYASWQISVIEEFYKDGYSIFYNRMVKFMATFLFFLFMIICSASPFIIKLFTTAEYYEAWKYVPILSLGIIFSCMSGLIGSVFSAIRESKYFFYSSLWGAISAIVFNLTLIPKWGIMGASFAVLISFIVMTISRIYYSYKYVKINSGIYYLILFFCAFITLVSTFVFEQQGVIVVSSLVTLFLIFINRNEMKQLCSKIIKYE